MVQAGKARYRILVVDDDPGVLRFFRTLLNTPEFQVVTASSGAGADEAIAAGDFDLALVDLRLPDVDGLEVLRRIRRAHPHCRVVIMTGYGSVKTAVQAVQFGAHDYVEKPFEDVGELERVIRSALGTAERAHGTHPAIAAARQVGLVTGGDERMVRLLELAYVIAQKPATVLIQGETGTGKEVLARFIHRCSPRADRPFLAVNCAALAETLLESELFGHEKGAFTGATSVRRGIFELADGGTLLLDEIGEASLGAQAKLLRLLETGTFYRVGGERAHRVDVRVIAATNVPLEEAVHHGKFRADLFFRLDVVTLHLPPLRERRGDIPALVEHFLSLQGTATRGRPLSVHPQALSLLCRYPWPGNVRELANVLLRAGTLSEDGEIRPEHLPEKVVTGLPAGAGQAVDGEPPQRSAPGRQGPSPRNADELLEAWVREKLAVGTGSMTLTEVLQYLRGLERQAIRELIRGALRETMGNRRDAAALLGVTPRMIKYYLNERW